MHMAAARALSGLLLSTCLTSGPMPIFMMATPAEEAIAALEERRESLMAASQKIFDDHDAASTEPSDEDLETVNANATAVEQIDKQIKARQALLAPPGPGRRSTPEARAPGDGGDNRQIRLPASPRDSARQGFKSFGEFAHTLVAYARRDETAVQRMNNVATTYGAEAVGADGGFAVPPEFKADIWKKVNSIDNLLGRCAQLPVAGNSITIPKDETTPWQSSGGVLAYWEGEGDVVTASKPQLKLDTLRLAKLMALVPISEELLADAPAIEGWLRLWAPQKMVAKINTAIISGTGVGQPLGILNGAALISVAKETSQDAASVWFANIVKMWSRLYAPLRGNAIWLINQDVEQQLYQMAFDPEATSKVPVYLPPGGLSASPYGTLMGRPVVPVEACSTVGTQGDIILADMSQYLAIVKAGGQVQTDVSMHLYFDQALQAFRFIFRVNGQPMWSSTIARQNGSNTLSWSVALDARA